MIVVPIACCKIKGKCLCTTREHLYILDDHFVKYWWLTEERDQDICLCLFVGGVYLYGVLVSTANPNQISFFRLYSPAKYVFEVPVPGLDKNSGKIQL